VTLFCLVGILWLAWATIIDGQLVRPPLTFQTEPIQVEKEVYHPGEIVRGYMTFCKNRNMTGVVQWSLVDTYLKIYPNRDSAIAQGCYEKKLVEIEVIPMDSYPDMYHYEGTVTYRINAVNTSVVKLRTVPFRVVR
ncbi:MAG TPA: hypothetical protein VIG74_04435, partial [Alphaproteobacteria bacterium]